MTPITSRPVPGAGGAEPGSAAAAVGRILASAGLLVALASACGGGSGDATSSDPIQPTGASEELGVAVPSHVSGFPLPSAAELDATVPPVDNDLNGGAHHARQYRLPEGVTIEQLDAWYDDQLPMGVGWADWGWCEEGPDLDLYSAVRTYWRPGTDNIAEVDTFWDESARRAFVSVNYLEITSEPCPDGEPPPEAIASDPDDVRGDEDSSAEAAVLSPSELGAATGLDWEDWDLGGDDADAEDPYADLAACATYLSLRVPPQRRPGVAGQSYRQAGAGYGIALAGVAFLTTESDARTHLYAEEMLAVTRECSEAQTAAAVSDLDLPVPAVSVRTIDAGDFARLVEIDGEPSMVMVRRDRAVATMLVLPAGDVSVDLAPVAWQLSDALSDALGIDRLDHPDPEVVMSATSAPQTSTTRSPFGGEDFDLLLNTIDLADWSVERYEGVRGNDTHLIVLPTFTNTSDRDINAFQGIFLIKVTDVFGSVDSVAVLYQFREDLGAGETLVVTDKFQQVGEEYAALWWDPNQFDSEEMAIWGNAARDDATVEVVFTTNAIVFADGTTAGEALG